MQSPDRLKRTIDDLSRTHQSEKQILANFNNKARQLSAKLEQIAVLEQVRRPFLFSSRSSELAARELIDVRVMPTGAQLAHRDPEGCRGPAEANRQGDLAAYPPLQRVRQGLNGGNVDDNPSRAARYPAGQRDRQAWAREGHVGGEGKQVPDEHRRIAGGVSALAFSSLSCMGC